MNEEADDQVLFHHIYHALDDRLTTIDLQDPRIGAIACAAHMSAPPRNATDFLELAENGDFGIGSQGSQKKIIPHLACLLARLLRYIHRRVSRYAPLDVPCRRTQIQRNLVELFLTVTLRPAHFVEYVKDNSCQVPDEKRDGYRQKSAYGHLHEQGLRIGPQAKRLPHISTPKLYRF